MHSYRKKRKKYKDRKKNISIISERRIIFNVLPW